MSCRILSFGGVLIGLRVVLAIRPSSSILLLGICRKIISMQVLHRCAATVLPSPQAQFKLSFERGNSAVSDVCFNSRILNLLDKLANHKKKIIKIATKAIKPTTRIITPEISFSSRTKSSLARSDKERYFGLIVYFFLLYALLNLSIAVMFPSSIIF